MSKELVERLRLRIDRWQANGPTARVSVPLGELRAVSDLIERQSKALDRLDVALCQFLNNAGDEYDPRVWLPSVKRDLDELAKVYNDCHRSGVMDLRRAALYEGDE